MHATDSNRARATRAMNVTHPTTGATWLDAVGLTLFVATQLWWGTEIVAAGDGLFWLWLPLALALGHALTDLLSGVAHWLGDRFGSPDTPLLGSRFIHPFREHHDAPAAITRHGFLELNGNSALAMLPLSACAALLWPAAPGAASALVGVGLWWTLTALLLTNQFHRWAHDETVPAWVARLQRWRLILSPHDHDVHHKAPHDTYYCITCGWLNPLLARVHFFARCEALLGRRDDAEQSPSDRADSPVQPPGVDRT